MATSPFTSPDYAATKDYEFAKNELYPQLVKVVDKAGFRVNPADGAADEFARSYVSLMTLSTFWVNTNNRALVYNNNELYTSASMADIHQPHILRSSTDLEFEQGITINPFSVFIPNSVKYSVDVQKLIGHMIHILGGLSCNGTPTSTYIGSRLSHARSNRLKFTWQHAALKFMDQFMDPEIVAIMRKTGRYHVAFYLFLADVKHSYPNYEWAFQFITTYKQFPITRRDVTSICVKNATPRDVISRWIVEAGAAPSVPSTGQLIKGQLHFKSVSRFLQTTSMMIPNAYRTSIDHHDKSLLGQLSSPYPHRLESVWNARRRESLQSTLPEKNQPMGRMARIAVSAAKYGLIPQSWQGCIVSSAVTSMSTLYSISAITAQPIDKSLVDVFVESHPMFDPNNINNGKGLERFFKAVMQVRGISKYDRNRHRAVVHNWLIDYHDFARSVKTLGYDVSHITSVDRLTYMEADFNRVLNEEDVQADIVDPALISRYVDLSDEELQRCGGLITVKQLVTPSSLRTEGREMKHCVSGYARRVINTESLIFSFIDPTGARATAEFQPIVNPHTGMVDRVDFIQLRGPLNSEVTSPAILAAFNAVDSAINAEGPRRNIMSRLNDKTLPLLWGFDPSNDSPLKNPVIRERLITEFCQRHRLPLLPVDASAQQPSQT